MSISYQTVELLLLIINQKTDVTFFVWNEYNFDDIDKLMLKRKAEDEFMIIYLKQRNFSKMARTLHSCNTTVWALRSFAVGKPSAQYCQAKSPVMPCLHAEILSNSSFIKYFINCTLESRFDSTLPMNSAQGSVWRMEFMCVCVFEYVSFTGSFSIKVHM